MQHRQVMIEIKNLSHSFGGDIGKPFPVLDNISLSVYENEIVCLVGRSGCGKSTLLNIISGLLQPTHGKVLVAGKRVHEPQSGVSFVFQNFALFPWLTVIENVALGLEAQGIDPSNAREDAVAGIDLIGLEGHQDAYPRELSGGMQQRVGLARALVVKPSLLLMDEPFSSLDILSADILRNDILDLWLKKQMTCKSILTVTHNIEEAVAIANRIIVLSSNPGQIIAEIPVHLPHPRHRFSSDFRNLVDNIYESMTAKEILLAEKKREQEKLGIGVALPWVPMRNLFWLLEELSSKHKAAHDLGSLAINYNIQYKELINIAVVLQLLSLCTIEHEHIFLTEHGKKLVAAAHDERKKILHSILLKHIPLIERIHQTLKQHGKHVLRLEHVQKELAPHLPDASIQETLHAVTSWARYANLFDYNPRKQVFVLIK